MATFAASYLGRVQWALAAQGPAALKAIAPAVTTADYYAAPWHSEGGALSLHMTMWWSTLLELFAAQRSASAGTGSPDAIMEKVGALVDLDERLAVTPVNEQPALAGSWWQD